MQVELKKLSIYERMSEETTAFVADVYVDKKKVAYAKNEGRGGSTFVSWDPTIPADERDAIEAELKKTVPAEYASFTRGVEWAVDQAVEAKRKDKDDKRIAKLTAQHDAFYKERCAKRGTQAARFCVPAPGGETTRWVEFRSGEEDLTREQVTKKHGVISNWTVVA